MSKGVAPAQPGLHLSRQRLAASGPLRGKGMVRRLRPDCPPLRRLCLHPSRHRLVSPPRRPQAARCLTTMTPRHPFQALRAVNRR